MPLSNQIAIVTGASSGIGLATIQLLAKRGATVIGCARNEEKLHSAKIVPIQCDVTNETGVQSLVDRVLDKYGKMNILVNNAGILESGSILDTNLSQYDRVMNVNLRSIYNMCMLCAPQLVKTKGNIVNVSSVNGIRSIINMKNVNSQFAGVLAYNISKAGLDQLTRCVALELADKGVRVNSVNPGVTVTSLHLTSGMTPETYKTFLERSKSTHAMGRPGRVEEVAAAIAYLCGPGASFITGATLPVDGGRHAMCPR